MKNIFVTLTILCVGVLLFSSCQKEISSETGVQQIAEGSLLDSLGNCSPDSVFGTFYGGVTPGSDTAYVEVQVNVTQVGSYTIETDLQNGIQFADSGFFTTTGINTVLLKPVGIPIQPIGIAVPPTTFTYSVMFDSSLCNFSVTFLDSTGTGVHGGGDTTGNGDPDSGSGSGIWQFTQGSFTFDGNLDSASKDNSTGLATFVYIGGNTSSGDTTMSLRFIIPAADIQTGTYTLISNGIFFNAVDASTLTVLYSADGLTTGTDMTIVITSYDSANKIMKGTFSGKAKDQSGNIVPITNGSFTATVSP